MKADHFAAVSASLVLLAGCASPQPAPASPAAPDASLATLLIGQETDRPAHFLVNPQGLRMVWLDGEETAGDAVAAVQLRPGTHHVQFVFQTRSHGSAYTQVGFEAEAGHSYRALYRFSPHERSVPIWIQDDATGKRVSTNENSTGLRRFGSVQ